MNKRWGFLFAALLSSGLFACSGADDSEPTNDPIGDNGADDSNGTEQQKTRHDTLMTPQVLKTRH
jgi:hypothetical protein